MDLKEHYDKLYQQSINYAKSNNFEVDHLIDSPNDNRYGITLLFRPNQTVKNNIQSFLEDLKLVEPDQYYYQDSDIHVTTMSIISCYEGFDINNIDVADYKQIIEQSIKNIGGFNVHFKGITASKSCIMVQGFLDSTNQNDIRDNLRMNFSNTALEQSMDKRYAIKTAHSTVVRFRQKVKNIESFVDSLNNFRNYKFGSFYVDTLELVNNDWYQKADKVKLLEKFKLGS